VASAWGKSWGAAFGSAFGSVEVVPPIVRPDADRFYYAATLARQSAGRYTADPTIARLAQRIANNRRRR
jgi:hypothetical protein